MRDLNLIPNLEEMFLVSAAPRPHLGPSEAHIQFEQGPFMGSKATCL
jgi:hypothetical protein